MSAETTAIVLAATTSKTVIMAGLRGPAGQAGSTEEEAVYAKRVDFVSDYLLYRAEAAVGSADASPVWRIRRITFAEADGDVTEQWAGGSAAFDKVWNDRLTYGYV
jgi:hypothetical protein